MKTLFLFLILPFSLLAEIDQFSMRVAIEFVDNIGLKIYSIDNIPEYNKSEYELLANSSGQAGLFSIITKKKGITVEDIASISVKKFTPRVYTREEVLRQAKNSGDVITEAQIEYLIKPQEARAEVYIDFRESSHKKLAEFSKANVGRNVVLVVNGAIVSAPRINESFLGGKIQVTSEDYEKAAKWVSEFNKTFKAPKVEVGASKGESSHPIIKTDWITDIKVLNKLLDERIAVNKVYKKQHVKKAEGLGLADKIKPIEIRFGQAWIDLLEEAKKSNNIKLKTDLLRVELLSEVQGALYDMEYAPSVEALNEAKHEWQKWSKKLKELSK